MRWALITGGARRLGRAAALELARAGWGVVIQYNASQQAAEALVREIEAAGGVAGAIDANLALPDIAHSVLEDARARAEGAIHALVNCAAVFEHDTPSTIESDLFMRAMQVNALAPSQLAAAFAGALAEGETGAVVNFLDFKLAAPYPDHFSYTLSKYALAGATELLARALAPKVRVNAVAPGYVLPSPGQSDRDFARLHAQTPLARGTTDEDIAKAVRFLIESPAISGQTIYVDSGLRFRSHERDFTFQ